MKTFTTKKGTELPLLDLRGKDYLVVAYRIVWMREEHPLWTIETTPVELTPTNAVFKATIRDETGRILSTAHKHEDKQGFPDFLEKGETGAIGRALALVGYGTQFCADELDEGSRLADSPIVTPRQTHTSQPGQAIAPRVIVPPQRDQQTPPGESDSVEPRPGEKPMCCGRELKFSSTKQKYFCGNWKAAVNHVKPMTKEAYENWQPDLP